MKAFKISNFRVFGSEGTIVNFKPVSILTGTNSSGKSSFVKAMVLFKDYLDKIRKDYYRDGYFDPAAYTLDFTRADLKLKGFSNVMNRDAAEGAVITFAYDLDYGFVLGKYNVEYRFRPGTKKGLDTGMLDSIVISCDGQKVFDAMNDGNTLKVEDANINNALLCHFLCYEYFDVIPCNLMDSYKNIYGDVDNFSVLDEDGYFRPEKLAETDKGNQLLRLQKTIFPDLNTIALGVVGGQYPHQDWLKALKEKDITDLLEKMDESSVMFYFPVLEVFKSKDKQECVRILREDAFCSKTLEGFFSDPFHSENSDRKPLVEKVIDAFMTSDKESFYDYYLDLENKFLSSFRKPAMEVHRAGKKFDFIIDHVRRGIDCVYDNMGLCGSDEFTDAYDMMSAWQWGMDEKTNDQWVKENEDKKYCSIYDKENMFVSRSVYVDGYSSSHKLYDAYKLFVEYILRITMMPDDFSELTYFNGSFSAVQRLHSFEEDSILTRTVLKYLEMKDAKEEGGRRGRLQNDYKPGTFLNKWLEELSIGKSLRIDIDDEGLGFKLFVEKKDGTFESLADLGHGATQMTSLLLLLESSIMSCAPSTMPSLEEEDMKVKPIIIIEEPEVSMHPSMQSKLALMFEEASRYDIDFIVETHSEYMVRSSQAFVARMKTEEEFDRNPFVVYYFNEDGTAYDLEYTKSGRFAKNFGSGFFDEAGKSSIEVLRREKEARK